MKIASHAGSIWPWRIAPRQRFGLYSQCDESARSWLSESRTKSSAARQARRSSDSSLEQPGPGVRPSGDSPFARRDAQRLAASSIVRPAKKRSFDELAPAGRPAASLVRASSRASSSSAGGSSATSRPSSSTRCPPPPRLAVACRERSRPGCGAWPRPRRRRSGRGCSSAGRSAVVHQPQVRLVDQGRGLERLAGLLLGQLLRRQPAQLVVDQRQELLGGVGVALLDRREDAGHVVHRRYQDA